MARRYGNAVRKESLESDSQGAKAPSGNEKVVNATRRAQNVIRALSVVPAKRIAVSLDVAVRTVQKWVSGESSIPAERMDEIQREAVSYFHEVDAIHKATVQDLLLNYGSQNGHSSRGGYV